MFDEYADDEYLKDNTVSLSNGHSSHDDQVADVVSYLSLSDDAAHVALMDRFVAEFPEYNHLAWSGSRVDVEASDVNPDYMSWVTDWLEQYAPVQWMDGEPYLLLPSAEE